MNIYPINFNSRKLKIHGRAGADQSVIAEIFKYREYRRAEQIISQAKSLIIDVGAHIGAFTLYCKAINPTVKILALEPEPKNFFILQKNISTNHVKGATVLEAALADKTTTAKFLITPDSHNHRLWLQADQTNSPGDKNFIQVKTLSLAKLCQKHKIPSIDLMKLDIEGGEYQILNALRSADYQKLKNVILEYHDSKSQNHKTIENILRQNGFSVETFPSKFDNQLGFLLARNKRR